MQRRQWRTWHTCVRNDTRPVTFLRGCSMMLGLSLRLPSLSSAALAARSLSIMATAVTGSRAETVVAWAATGLAAAWATGAATKTGVPTRTALAR